MLNGKVAIITGANRGIGLATVEAFAQNRATIWACARRRTEEFEAKIHEMSLKYHVSIFTLYFDVSDQEAVKQALRHLGKESEHIDILVNNAGVSVERLFNLTTMDTVEKVMRNNFYSQFAMTQNAVRYMMRTKTGSIINVGSVAGIEPELGGIAYGSSKAAILFSTGTLALELGKYGVRVNSISPGFIDTDMWANRSEAVKEKVLQETALHRQGRPEEVAQVILFLASDMSSYITGQNIIVDGGRRLGL